MASPLLVVLGGINMDLITHTPRFPRPGETVVGTRFFTTPGGKGANQAVAAARLGASVRMVGRVGADIFGPQLVEGLRAEGIDVSGVGTDPGTSSGIAVINIDQTAQNQIIQVPGANHTCGPAEVEQVKVALEGASALMLQMELPVQVTLEAARLAARRGVPVVFDPAPPVPFPSEMFRLVSYLTPNETEAEALVGFPVTEPESAEKAARRLLERGVPHVLVKMGAQGAFLATRDTMQHYPAIPVKAVDTVAAGDAFNAGLAVALSEGRPLKEAVWWAVAAGAIAVTKPGAQTSMPHRQEVEALLKKHRT